jgi:enoyl-CoA hydratase
MNTLLVEQNSGVATITLNRPDKLNAINAELLGELGALLPEIAADDAVRSVVITGAGARAFAAGADIAELHGQDESTGQTFSARGQRVFDAVEHLGKPVIAAVNGFALGGGCELALACHIRFASATAKLGLPEISLGILPGYGGTQRLPRLLGTARALEIILSCEMVDAQTALQIGLVNCLVEPDALLPTAQEFAAMLATRPVHSMRAALEAVLTSRDTTVADGQRVEASIFGVLCGTADFKEGTQAFLEKRKAVFTGS